MTGSGKLEAAAVAPTAVLSVPADHGNRVVVVGAGMGGLSAAIHLRLQGREVVLLEAGKQTGGRAGRISSGGFHWDTGPTLLNYPWCFQDLFQAAGRRLEDYVDLLLVDPSVGFSWPDGASLHLSSDYGRLLRELSRFQPAVGPGLASWLHDCHRKYQISFQKLVTRNAGSVLDWIRPLSLGDISSLAVWRSLDGELGRFFRNRRIREALGSYAMYLGGSPFQLPGIFAILPYGEIGLGLWHPRGGIYSLVRAMEQLAGELGVEIETGARASIVTREGRVAGVQVGQRLIQAPVVVSNVDVPTTETEVFGRPTRRLRMTPGVLTFYWGIRGGLERAGHHTIFLPSQYRGAFRDLMRYGRIPSEPPFYLSMPSQTDSSLAPPGHNTVFVLIPTPTLDRLEGTDWSLEVSRLRKFVLDRLADRGVQLAPERIIAEHVWTPVDWREEFGLFQGSAFGAAHNLLQIGPFRSPNACRRVRGLYYTGAGTTPGTGLPLVVLSGRMTAEKVAMDFPVRASRCRSG